MHMRPDHINNNDNKEGASATKGGKALPDLEALYEESLRNVREGAVVEGRVVDVQRDYALVDIHYKAEGRVPIREFTTSSGEPTVKVGDTVEVLVVKREDEEARPVLSIHQAARAKVWEAVKHAHGTHDTIRGKIISPIKGGFHVDIGLKAFLPASHLDLGRVTDVHEWVGKACDFKVLQYDKRRGNIVLSRKALLMEQREKQQAILLDQMEKGAVVQGVVKNITDYGLFVDLGGLDGLVHVSQISWSKIGHPSQLYRIGDEVKVKILDIAKKKKRVSLGIKQLIPAPGEEAGTKY